MNSRLNSRLPLSFWLAILIALVNSVSFTLIIPILYPYAKDLGLSDFEASLLNAVYAICQFVTIPFLGKLSDCVGRKPLLIICLSGSAVSHLLAGFSSLAWLLFTARIIDGLTGANISVARALVSDSTNLTQRSRSFGIFEAAIRLGFVIGPTMSYLVQRLPSLPGVSSLAMSFLISASIALLATLLCVVWLPETLPEKQPFHFQWSDLGFSIIAKLTTAPRLNAIFGVSFLSGLTLTMFTFAFQPFWLTALGQEPQTLALIFALTGLLGIIAQLFFLESLTKQFGSIGVLATVLIFRGMLFLLMPVIPYIIPFLVLLIGLSIVNSFPRPLTMLIVSLRSREQEQGENLGINTAYLSISNALGPAIAGLLVGFSPTLCFWVAGGLTLLAASFSLKVKPTAA
jgi:MFS family permease